MNHSLQIFFFLIALKLNIVFTTIVKGDLFDEPFYKLIEIRLKDKILDDNAKLQCVMADLRDKNVAKEFRTWDII